MHAQAIATVALVALWMGWGATDGRAQDAAALRATFEASLADIEASYSQRLDALGDAYVKSLEALFEQHRAQGDFAGTLASKGELERFRAARNAAETLSDHASTRVLQEKHRQAAQQHRLERARQSGALADQYNQALDRLQRGHVVAGELDAAQAVQRERERVGTLASLRAARELVARTPPATPPAAVPPAAQATPKTSADRFTLRQAQDLIARMDKLSEQDWRRLPGVTVSVDADPTKIGDTGVTLAPGDTWLVVPHPRDTWTPWHGRVEACDFRGLRGTPGRPRIRIGDFAPMALCGVVGNGFPFPIENNYLVTGRGKLELSPGLRAVRLEGGQPRGAIRVKLIPVDGE